MTFSLVKYPNANAVEATWLDDEGKQIHCQAYADVQLDMIRADVARLGGDLAEHEAMLAEVEAAIVPYVAPEPTPLEKLQRLDAENALTQRNLRETVMLMAEAFKQVTNGAVDLSAIPGVAKVYEVEAQAAVLRAQL